MQFLHADEGSDQTDLSLCWEHMSEGTFSHIAVLEISFQTMVLIE